MELPTRQDFLSGRIKLNPLVNVRYIMWEDPLTGKTYGPLFPPDVVSLINSRMGITPSGGVGSTGGLPGLGGFGLSKMTFGISGEVERARLDILERMKRTTDSRAKSRLTLPRLFGDGNKEKNILADVL